MNIVKNGLFKKLLLRNRFVVLRIIFFIGFICSNSYALEKERVWIYFTDKGNVLTKDIPEMSRKHLSKKSIERRFKKTTPIEFDFTDLPVNNKYIQIIKNEGVEIIHKSKWFNAVSALVRNNDYSILKSLSFVKKIEPIKSFKFYNFNKDNSVSIYKTSNFDYGSSYNQNEMIGVPAWHSKGYNANGVRIAIFDTGFKTTHEALQSVNVIASWDFVENDNDVSGTYGSSHGTKVLGVIAGNSQGHLIGPAFGAEYILAKTDDYITETHLDEDNWVAAAEWADSLGADIISSSVGYNIFDPGEGDYTYADMNGDIAIVTIAADLAVKKGIAVFASAGNEGGNSWYHIIAPADGDSVIAIGNVNSTGTISFNSSRGPTFDGRIKPDLVAQGTNVYTVSTHNPNSYIPVSGTSYSTPLAAGAGALVLGAYPNLKPMQLYTMLISNASLAYTPNNDYGYGVINIAPLLKNNPTPQPTSTDSIIKIESKIPFIDKIKIVLDKTSFKSLFIYNSLGQRIKLFDKYEKPLYWYGYNDNNTKVSSGVYFIVLFTNNSIYTKKVIFLH